MPPDPSTIKKKKVTVCAVCKQEVLSAPLKCTDCPGDIDLCVECLATGQEAPEIGHLRTHSYRVLDNLAALNLFDKEWSADEELQLLEGIEIYGLGNWRDISGYIGTKTDSQCAKHYVACYLESPSAPLPAPLGSPSSVATASNQPGSGSGAAGDASASSSAAAAALEPAEAADGAGAGAGAGAASAAGPPQHRGGRKKKVVIGSDGEPVAGGGAGAGAATATSTRTGDRGSGHTTATPGYSTTHVPKTDIAGYMPLRGDFDIEYDNDAEAVIADMDFVEGEHATETELKLKILEIYNAKLDERERRKAFIIERGLLDYKRLLSVERRRPKDEREVYDAFRPFARFLTPQEHEDLVRGIILEQRLRKRIAQLQEYRRNGIRSLAEAQEYENQKRKREQAASMRRQSANYLYDGRPGGAVASSSAAAAGAGAGRRGRGAAADDDGAGSASSAAIDSFANAAGGEAAGRGRRGRKRRLDDADVDKLMAVSEAEYTSAGPAACALAAGAGAGAASSSSSAAASSSSSFAGMPLAASSGTGKFSVAGLPGADRLSEKERALCEHLRLTPSQYQQIKATIVNISLVRGYVKRSDAAGKLVHVDAAKIGSVYDFVVTCGLATAAGKELDAGDQ